MKKLIFVILTLIIVVFSAGCGSYILPSEGSASASGANGILGGNVSNGNDDGTYNGGSGGNKGDGSGNTDDGGEDDGNGGTYGYTFTVTLVKNGSVYTNSNGIEAQWTGKRAVYSAPFENGVATISGIQGEYHVTLSTVPQNHTYDPNGYIANNGKRNIEIELLEIIKPTKGSGSKSNMYEIVNMGTYRVNITSATNEVWFYYYPNRSGWYSITSWVDTTKNIVNPRVTTYNGNIFSGFFVKDKTIDKGGSAGTYTKNFRFEVKYNWDEIGNTQIFTVGAESSDKKYPVTVDFTLKYEGEYIRNDYGDPVFADSTLFYKGSTPSGTFNYIYKDNNNILDGKRVKLNPADNYYHIYDEKAYASANGFGPLLFAKLAKDTEIVETREVMSGKLIDMGFNWNHLNGGMISCVVDGNDYAYMISGGKDDSEVYHSGYADYCNSDGVHPVTEEIKNFLLGYASREWYFDDGEGWAENIELNGKVALRSSENDQWLFACGYYK